MTTKRKVPSTAVRQSLSMASLANIHRPKLLSDLVGQEHISTEITGMLNKGRFHPTILLNGPSGCGKTTIARLIARYVLCKNPESGTHTPCGVCPSCKYGDSHPDVSEINMADARGIDDVRALIQSSKSMPTLGDNRIFIIDECFPGDTEVLLSNGKASTMLAIVNSESDFEVMSRCNTGERRPNRVTNRWSKIADRNTMVRVVTSEGYQDCTNNHKWWSVTRNQMIRADELRQGEILSAFAPRERDQLVTFGVKLVKPLYNTAMPVYDIEVEFDHNFYIRPKGSKHWVLVSNCHAATPQALQALLKPLEEPPSKTLWLLATTNPEKLPATILGRCRKFNVNLIEPKKMMMRLNRIAKREGVDFKTIEQGDEILKLISNLSNGQMRDGLGLLETALAVIGSGEKIDASTMMREFLKTSDSDLDKDSATILAALLGRDTKALIKSIRGAQSVRGLISKLRWLVQHLLDNAVGIAKYQPYNAKLFAAEAKRKGLSVKLSQLMQVQFLILETEVRLNSMSVDEQVVMLSMFGNHLTTIGVSNAG